MSDLKTPETLLKAQRKYNNKEEVKERKRQQYIKKRRKEIPFKINKLLEDIDDYTDEELQNLYDKCNFIIQRKPN
jgi:hypothetical protein